MDGFADDSEKDSGCIDPHQKNTMKDQYFGDINDNRKYGLLRSIIGASDLRVLVAWVLTPDDGSSHGNSRSYLEHAFKWSSYDPELFKGLQDILSRVKKPRVSLIESTQLLPKAQFFSDHIPDTASARSNWFKSLAERMEGSDLVFLNPDNGLEVKSKPYGRKKSSKFVYWREVEALWFSGKSLLIYQHFIRENRINFIQRLLEKMRNVMMGSFVEAFSTPNVVFFLALQPEHQHFHEKIVTSVQKSWEGQIKHWSLLTCDLQGTLAGDGTSIFIAG